MPERFPAVNAVEFAELLQRGDPIAVLDVREEFEHAYCSIPIPPHAVGIHIPLNTIPQRLEDLRGLPHNLPIVVYCHHGVRSLAAGRWLVERGIVNVFNLEGGIDAWSLCVDPSIPRY